MKKLRAVLFWCHLTAGIGAGLVILIMSVTGALLAFESQIVDALERGVRSHTREGARLQLAQRDWFLVRSDPDRPSICSIA